jgi:hypothetical protein
MMKLDLSKLKGLVKEYGSPLYPSVPTTEAGSVAPGEYSIEGGNKLKVVDGDVTYYFPIRTQRVEAGVSEDQVFNIGVFTASRDASGEYNGKPWSVTAGETKVFAY